MTRKIEIKKLPEIPNICNQVLREVWKSKDVSIAHVKMVPGNISLLHKHVLFTELYYILNGKGILFVDNEEFMVAEDTLVEIPPGVSHKLKNVGEFTLSHLVISNPPFNPKDVEVLNE